MAQIDEIVGKSNIQGVMDLDKALVALDETFMKVLKSSKETSTILNTQSDSWNKLKIVQEQTADATKKLTSAEKETEKIEKKIAEAAEKNAKAIDASRKAIEMEVKSVAEARIQNKELIKLRDSLNTRTKEGQRAIRDLNKQIDENNKTIKDNASNLEKQKINVGNYISSWGPFQGVANMVTRGIAIMKIAFISLKAAIISTGIGALVVLLGSLYTYFTRSGEGADKFAKSMGQVRAVIDVLLDRFAKFGEGLVDIFSGRFKEGAEKIGAAFKGIGAELKEEVKTAGEIADKLDEIDEKRRKYQEEIAKNQIRISRLEEIARDKESYSLEERKAAIDEIMGLKRKNASMTNELNQAEIDQINKQGEMRVLNDEEQQKLTDARVKAMTEEAAAQDDINSSLKLRNTIYAAINEQQAKLTERALSEQMGITEKAALGAQQIELDIHAETLEMREQMDNDWIDREYERLQRERDMKINIGMETAQALQQLGSMVFEAQAANIQAAMERNEEAKQYELQLAEGNASQIALIEEKYDKKAKALKQKQAKQNKANALFQAIINTAIATTNGFLTVPFFPLGLAMGILAGVLGTVQIGLIASQPIPQFFKGTKSAPDGVISVAEKGEELIKTRSGKLLMATRPTLLSGMKGAQIYTNKETEQIMKLKNVGYDSKELQRTLRENNQDLIRTIKNKKEITITPAMGSRVTEREGTYFKTYFNRKLG